MKGKTYEFHKIFGSLDHVERKDVSTIGSSVNFAVRLGFSVRQPFARCSLKVDELPDDLQEICNNVADAVMETLKQADQLAWIPASFGAIRHSIIVTKPGAPQQW